MGAWLQKILRGELGWKTLVSALLIVGSVIGQSAGWITADQAEKLLRSGEALGFVGLRDAMSKLKG